MTAQPKSVIKSYFETGDQPTQAQFGDLVDSYADFGTTFSNYYVDTGTANNYVITPNPALASYTAGTTYAVKITHANTGNSTINVSGLGAKAITYIDGTGLSSGAMPLNSVVLITYDGTQFQLINITPSSGGSGITQLTGDVTAAGSGSVVATIANNAVTLAKLATQSANTVLANATTSSAVPTAVSLSASTVLGRDSTGNVSALTLSGLTAVGGVLTAAGGIKGIQYFTSSGTYTPTSGTSNAVVFCQGGGGGGGGSSTQGGSGGTTSFGSQCSATGGGAGREIGIGTGGAAGTASNGIANITGQAGTAGSYYDSTVDFGYGGSGGKPQFLGYAGVGAFSTAAGTGTNGMAGNLGGGGGAAGSSAGTNVSGGGGGSGGLAIDFCVISGTETVTIGAAGTAGSGGTPGFAGGTGYILVLEF